MKATQKTIRKSTNKTPSEQSGLTFVLLSSVLFVRLPDWLETWRLLGSEVRRTQAALSSGVQPPPSDQLPGMVAPGAVPDMLEDM